MHESDQPSLPLCEFNLPSQRSGQLRSGMPPNNTLQGVTMKSTITTQQWPKEQYHCTEWSVTLDIICSSCHIWWDNVTSWHNVTRLQCYKLAQEVKTRALELSKLLYYTVKALDTCISIVKLLYYTVKAGRDQTLDCLPPTAIYRTAFVCDHNLIPRTAATLCYVMKAKHLQTILLLHRLGFKRARRGTA